MKYSTRNILIAILAIGLVMIALAASLSIILLELLIPQTHILDSAVIPIPKNNVRRYPTTDVRDVYVS